MKTLTTIVFALLAVACTTTAPQKIVTLHDVDRDLAQSEGTDLRYQVAEKPDCGGLRGCRDVKTTGATLEVYKWQALCDGRFCDAEELQLAEVIREAANLAFTAEQVVAANELLAGNNRSSGERALLEAFVLRASTEMNGRLAATERFLTETGGSDELRKEAEADVERAWTHLRRARSLLAKAGLTQPHSRGTHQTLHAEYRTPHPT